MNKLTKAGVTALCGTLAAVSAASAGELSVKGGATATFTKLGYGVTGNPLGMASGMTFTGSGELDNGSTVTINITQDDKVTYSASDISIDIPGFGKLTYDEGGGTGIDRFDDMMPTAWEETTGTGVSTGLVSVSGVGGGTDIEWAISSDMLPDGVSAYVSYSPKPDGLKASDKAGTGAHSGSAVDGSGWDIAVSSTAIADGLNVFAGYSTIDQSTDDHTAYVIGATYAVGNFTVGYQYSMDDVNNASGSTDAYENQAFGVSFAVNDDLSMSYGRNESERGDTGLTGTTVEADSFQIAYSMGGATIKLAETSVDNANYDSTTASDREGTTLALSLAF